MKRTSRIGTSMPSAGRVQKSPDDQNRDPRDTRSQTVYDRRTPRRTTGRRMGAFTSSAPLCSRRLRRVIRCPSRRGPADTCQWGSTTALTQDPLPQKKAVPVHPGSALQQAILPHGLPREGSGGKTHTSTTTSRVRPPTGKTGSFPKLGDLAGAVVMHLADGARPTKRSTTTAPR